MRPDRHGGAQGILLIINIIVIVKRTSGRSRMRAASFNWTWQSVTVRSPPLRKLSPTFRWSQEDCQCPCHCRTSARAQTLMVLWAQAAHRPAWLGHKSSLWLSRTGQQKSPIWTGLPNPSDSASCRSQSSLGWRKQPSQQPVTMLTTAPIHNPNRHLLEAGCAPRGRLWHSPPGGIQKIPN